MLYYCWFSTINIIFQAINLPVLLKISSEGAKIVSRRMPVFEMLVLTYDYLKASVDHNSILKCRKSLIRKFIFS